MASDVLFNSLERQIICYDFSHSGFYAIGGLLRNFLPVVDPAEITFRYRVLDP